MARSRESALIFRRSPDDTGHALQGTDPLEQHRFGELRRPAWLRADREAWIERRRLHRR